MLMDIKKLLQQRAEMSLTDIARHFTVSETVMQSMLAQWQKKGRLEVFDYKNVCSTGCGSCNESEQSAVFYRWKMVAEKPISVKVS